MRWLFDLRLERGLVWIGIFMSIAALGAVAFVMSGVFNVAANVRHFGITEKIIGLALDRSVALRGGGSIEQELDEPGLVRLGALHFEIGCAACHGRPGQPASPIAQNMYPAPPSLDGAATEWSDSELAWIVYSGLKMTGMPAWSGKGREEEVWPLVAYIKALPEIDNSEYSVLVRPAIAPDVPMALGPIQATVQYCESCHGSASEAPVTSMVPPLSIQSPRYLHRSLEIYRENLRQSGIMEPIAAELTDETISALASHFGRRAPSPPVPPANGEVSEGARLAWRGAPARDIPACFGCHGKEASPQFPQLQGLSERYVGRQLELFRSGVRAPTPEAQVMARIARRLSDADVKAVADYIGQMAGGAQQVEAAR